MDDVESLHSDEMSDGGEEFSSVPVTAVSETDSTNVAGAAFSRLPTSKLNPIGSRANNVEPQLVDAASATKFKADGDDDLPEEVESLEVQMTPAVTERQQLDQP